MDIRGHSLNVCYTWSLVLSTVGSLITALKRNIEINVSMETLKSVCTNSLNATNDPKMTLMHLCRELIEIITAG